MHKTTGFSPYQMLYGRPMRMPLDQMVRYWRGKEEQGQNTTIEFVETLKANMQVVRDLAYEKEIKEKESQKFYHDRKSVVRNFDVGEYVLVFRPTRKSTLENQWQGPYIISKKLTEVTYQVDLGTFGKRYRTFHVNCMRKWTSPNPADFMALDEVDLNHEKEDTHIMQTSHHIELEKLKSQFKGVLQDVPGRTTLVHHKIPTQVFDRLRSAGLRVKERKCSFAKNKCVYLGYVVGSGTIEPMECKVLAVQKFAQPRTKKQVRSFLGLCGYYRKFIPEFSTVASPLSDLTKRNMSKSVKWTSQCEKAFGQFKPLPKPQC